MKEFELPSAMDETQKETLLQQLENLIAQTYSVEKEYVALRSSYNQLQSLIHQIIEALPNALWVLNEDGTVFLQNSAAARIGEILENLDTDREEQEIAFLDRHFLVKSSRHDGKHIISATDITEQKRRERLASMGQMAAHLAHEIRNPIGSISLLISSLAKRVLPQNQPIVEEIKRSLFRVERIIKTTLMYSKGVQPRLLPIPLKSLRKECEAAVASYSYVKEIRFTYDFEETTILADKELLALALQNLLFNAIDAIEESDDDVGDVRVSAYREGERILFVFQDSGIALENPQRLFEAFHTTKTKGHGLGLALTYQIVRAHDGNIMAHTDPKRFILSLPARR